MKITELLIDCLEKSPIILKELIEQVPAQKLKERRRPGKWSIHENVCHLAQAEIMIQKRFEKFKTDPAPVFNPYLPGKTVPDGGLIDLNMNEQLEKFTELRAKTVDLIKNYDAILWKKKGKHSEYLEYDAVILLRHTLMHDHFHMYRIEELWLTKDEFL